MKKLFARLLSGAAAAGAACAAAGVVTVAIAFAVYAFAKTYVGPAGGSAIVALVFAAVLGVGLAVTASRAGGDKAKTRAKHLEPEPANLMGRIMETARERPFVAAAGAVAAGLLALRNPTLVATVLGLVNTPPRPRRD